MAQGKCSNFGNCDKADAQELILMSRGADSKCPECNSTLNPVSASQRNNKKPLFIIVGVITAIGAMAGGAMYVLQNKTHNVIVTQAGTGNGTLTGGGTFKENDTIILGAVPDDKSNFINWSPAPCADNFIMPNNDLTCIATFTLKPVVVSESPKIEIPPSQVKEKPVTGTNISTIESPVETSPAIQQVELQKEQYLKQGMNYISSAQQITNKKQRTEQFHNAIAELTKAIDVTKGNIKAEDCIGIANAYMNRGLVYLELNNPNLALEDLQSAEKCDSENGMIHYNIALYYAVKKQDDLALRALDKSLIVSNPVNDIFVKLSRSFCEELKNNTDLKALKKNQEFKVILEKNNLFCSNL